jgi:hypothetical protein
VGYDQKKMEMFKIDKGHVSPRARERKGKGKSHGIFVLGGQGLRGVGGRPRVAAVPKAAEARYAERLPASRGPQAMDS